MLLWNSKDGGPESKVWVWGVEFKWLCSILLLKFEEGSREAYHTHAFNSVSWLLKGELHEFCLDGYPWGMDTYLTVYRPSLRPIMTYRDTLRQVQGAQRASWVLTFRGPWVNKWSEWLPKHQR